MEMGRINEEKSRLEAQKNDALRENEEKKEELNSPLDSDKIEDIARDELDLVNPGDNIYVNDGNEKVSSHVAP